MKRAFERIAALCEAVEAVELMIFLGLLVTVGPFIWLHWIVMSDRSGFAIAVLVSWLASVGVIGFEVRRRAITAMSLFVFLAWIVILVFVFSDHFA